MTYFLNLLSSFNDEEGASATINETLLVTMIMFNPMIAKIGQISQINRGLPVR